MSGWWWVLTIVEVILLPAARQPRSGKGMVGSEKNQVIRCQGRSTNQWTPRWVRIWEIMEYLYSLKASPHKRTSPGKTRSSKLTSTWWDSLATHVLLWCTQENATCLLGHFCKSITVWPLSHGNIRWTQGGGSFIKPFTGKPKRSTPKKDESIDRQIDSLGLNMHDYKKKRTSQSASRISISWKTKKHWELIQIKEDKIDKTIW